MEGMKHNNSTYKKYDYLFSVLHYMKFLATYSNVLHLLKSQDSKYSRLKNHFRRSKVNTALF